MLRAVRAAIEDAVALHAMADDAAVAVAAGRRQCMDRAFERIVGAGAQRAGDGDGLVVIVAADVAGGHVRTPGGLSSLQATVSGARGRSVSRLRLPSPVYRLPCARRRNRSAAASHC